MNRVGAPSPVRSQPTELDLRSLAVATIATSDALVALDVTLPAKAS